MDQYKQAWAQKIMRDPDKRIDTRPLNAHPIGEPPTTKRGKPYAMTTRSRQWASRILILILGAAAVAGWYSASWGFNG
jgi:hypothetical protein